MSTEVEPKNILFLCTANSARSIMAEVIMNATGGEHYRAYSAGSQPSGQVNPLAVELLQRNRFSTEGLRSKSWDEFSAVGAPQMDFVITVCDDAAGETCPIWPGHPITAHWSVEDPAATNGSEEARRKAFLNAFTTLQRRVELFLSLPFSKLDKLALEQQLREIGAV